MSLFDRILNPVWSDISRLDAHNQRNATFLLTGYGACRYQINRSLVVPLSQSNALSLDTRERLIDEALVGSLKSCSVPQSDPTGDVPKMIVQSAADVWGMFALADCNHRSNKCQPTTLEGSLYSADPDEARTQVLVKWAEILGLPPADFVTDANMRYFLAEWRVVTSLIVSGFLTGFGRSPIDVLLKKTKSDAAALPTYQIAIARYMIQSMAKSSTLAPVAHVPNLHNAAKASIIPNHYPVSSLREHPFFHVPFEKVIALMQTLVVEVIALISAMPIEDYDLRRFAEVKNSPSARYLELLRAVDSLTLAYCIVVVAIARREPKFIDCGVWNQLSDAYWHELIKSPLITIISTAPAFPGMKDGKSRVLDILTQVRGSASVYIASTSKEGTGFNALVAGTFFLKHVMEDPTYSPMLSSVILQVLAGLEPALNEMAAGDLIPWPEQQQKMSAVSM